MIMIKDSQIYLTMYLKKAQLDWKLNDKAKLSIGLIGMNMFNIQEKTLGK